MDLRRLKNCLQDLAFPAAFQCHCIISNWKFLAFLALHSFLCLSLVNWYTYTSLLCILISRLPIIAISISHVGREVNKRLVKLSVGDSKLPQTIQCVKMLQEIKLFSVLLSL